MAEDKGLLERAGDWAREKLSNVPVITKPLTEVTKAMAPAATPPVPSTPQQRYEAKERYMNRNNPYYPFNGPGRTDLRERNVDNSGLTKEPLP
jgi:hypothetical protein